MYISQISLRNWKAYEQVTFEFPAPVAKQNIVLIGARNGYGKTSLFEAILLGIYGKDGFDLMRKPALLSGGDQQSSYSNFLKSVLRKNSGDGMGSCSVNMTLIDDSGNPIEINRTWHFSSSGEHRKQDDAVKIYEGVERKPIGPPPNQNESKEAWYRDYIARNLLPSNLSSFFWFDGEKASVFAERDMAEQVTLGITDLLGISIIQELAKDLRTYASDRRRQVPEKSDGKIDELEKEQEASEKRLEVIEDRLGKADHDVTEYKNQRDSLMQEISAFTGSQADTSNPMREVIRLSNNVNKRKEELESALETDMAFALAGANLRTTLSARLESESVLDKWETGKQQGDSRLDAFLEALDSGMVKTNIGAAQRADILSIARVSWEKLWFPPPENCADNYLHHYLSESDRGNIQQHLQRLGEINAPWITSLLDTIDADRAKLEQLHAEISRLESVAPHVEKKCTELNELSPKISVLEQEIGSLKNEKKPLEMRINQLHADLSKLYKNRDNAQPAARRASRAFAVAEMIHDIVESAVPSQTKEIAAAMTTAYKDIAHKNIVDKIEIDHQCQVKLLDKNGDDVRNVDASAGEKQIFTQALIFSISTVWGRTFPMVIDTPLGRLDKQHRKGVLTHLAKQDQQVILLSTDTEVVADYLDVIKPSIQKKYLITHNVSTSTSTVMSGYFTDEVST